MENIIVYPNTKADYGYEWAYDQNQNLMVSPLFAKIYNHLLKSFQENNFKPVTLHWKNPNTDIVITPILNGAYGKDGPNTLSDVHHFVYTVTPSTCKTAYTLLALTQALTQFQKLYQVMVRKESEITNYIKSADTEDIRYATRLCNFNQIPIEETAVSDFYHFMLMPPENALLRYPDDRSHDEAVNTLPALIEFLQKQDLYRDLYNQRLYDVLFH